MWLVVLKKLEIKAKSGLTHAQQHRDQPDADTIDIISVCNKYLIELGNLPKAPTSSSDLLAIQHIEMTLDGREQIKGV